MPSLKNLTDEMLRLDYGRTAEEVEKFIKSVVWSAGASGVVVGLSGGVDSSAVAALCTRALKAERVLGVIMPAEFTPAQDVEDAENLAETLGVRTVKAPIKPVVDSFAKQLGVDTSDASARMALANLRARVRMSILYFHANMHNLLVAGTGDRSELLLGYYTKYGDAGVDFLPVVGIYKTQLRHLSKHLGIPENIAFKPSSPQLYPGHRAVDELPADYDLLDPLLYALFDKAMKIEQVVEMGVDRRLVEELLQRYDRSRHKREMPPAGPRPIPLP
ncbi:MAG: NAD+ synthase [Candidatus Caldarchaeum sp.]|nr:NAD+ synthase [Candidatus Caldarchaeum sp.]MCS7137612.1 NAD+ synthase [Candidatus Caldarchaeum sp.]MDW8359170.1 NAD+ synthase [Candidatus Caldarchaeum sp.]